MKKYVYLIGVSVIFSSCGTTKGDVPNEKGGNDSITESEPVDSFNEEVESEYGEFSHPQSEWANKHTHHDVFYSERVEMWVSHKEPYQSEEPDGMMEYDFDILDRDQVMQLNAAEMIFYYLVYPGSYSQICAGDDYYDSTGTPKIKSYLPADYEASGHTTLQIEGLKANRDSIVLILSNYIKSHPDEVDVEYLDILDKLNAIESIPAIVKTASIEKTEFNYSLLVRLMHENKFKPFIECELYPYFYGQDSYSYGSRVEASDENCKLIKELAMKMYKEETAE